jgi:hypothetical protein
MISDAAYYRDTYFGIFNETGLSTNVRANVESQLLTLLDSLHSVNKNNSNDSSRLILEPRLKREKDSTIEMPQLENKIKH